MFTHPALLRELNQISDLLRRSGEAQWARRVAAASDALRKIGWTQQGAALMRDLQHGDGGLDRVKFGDENYRFVGGPDGAVRANQQLERHREKLEGLLCLPTRDAVSGPRPKSPDLL